ncbi:MAG: gas vesicle protein K [Chloroflexi bacterium]|nr:gas vesicle protein K [Chloroflexota bacterium]
MIFLHNATSEELRNELLVTQFDTETSFDNSLFQALSGQLEREINAQLAALLNPRNEQFVTQGRPAPQVNCVTEKVNWLSLGSLLAEPPVEPPVEPSVEPPVERPGLAKLILTLVDFSRQMIERQAIQQVEATFGQPRVPEMSETFIRLEARIQELKLVFKIQTEDLNQSADGAAPPQPNGSDPATVSLDTAPPVDTASDPATVSLDTAPPVDTASVSLDTNLDKEKE